jgi:hypothetical protein
MNGLVSFRLCKLSTPELLEKVDKLTDKMYQEQKVPTRHIPARPDSDYDLLVGELVKRMQEHEEFINFLESMLLVALTIDSRKNYIDLTRSISQYLSRPYGTPHTPLA